MDALLSHLGKKWAAPVIRQLQGGDRRFSQLRGAIGGVSEKMLAQTLRELARHGIVSRTDHSVVPPCVVYSLTPLGKRCAHHVELLLRSSDAQSEIAS